MGRIANKKLKVDKKEIDTYFNRHNKRLLTIANNIRSKHASTKAWEAEDLLSECYFHILQKEDKIDDESTLESYIIKFCQNQARWQKSTINLKYHPPLAEIEDTTQYIKLADDTTDLDDKIKIEQDFNHQMAIIYKFRNTLCAHERVIFDAIFDKGITKVNKLSEHFGINITYMQNQKKALFDKLKAYGLQQLSGSTQL